MPSRNVIQGLDGPTQDHYGKRPEANAGSLALVLCELCQYCSQRVSLCLSDTPSFQIHLPHATAVLLNPFDPASCCYAVLQSICLKSSLQNIATGNEADSIMQRGPLNHYFKNNF